MTDLSYYILCFVCAVLIVIGIACMSKVKSARLGNALSALAALAAIVITLVRFNILSELEILIAGGAALIIGLFCAYRVKMIQMPQTVALLNGFGGLASALIALAVLTGSAQTEAFAFYAGALTLVIGSFTFLGSLVAAGKLHGILPQKQLSFPLQGTIGAVLAAISIAGALLCGLFPAAIWICLAASAIFGVVFTLRVGGADMPITISLLNALSGVAGGIAGISVGDPLLCAAGGIVGASGLILTQIMCGAMNRSLKNIIFPKKSVRAQATPESASQKSFADNSFTLSDAKDIIIVPGYGMAIAQAQEKVKQLSDMLLESGARVRFAIHPVAGRMPGHMNVLLCEVDIPYDMLYDMESINEEFAHCDAVLIVGASDVVNPAANTAEGTPIYGMPVLRAAEAPRVIICNFDTRPGYAGVENPLYRAENARLILGDAKDSLDILIGELAK